jgi:hypothetical protein
MPRIIESTSPNFVDYDGMRRINPRLAKLAREMQFTMAHRGHTMQSMWVLRTVVGTPVIDIKCRKCGMEARANARPMPNETDIAGEAVALNCNGL